MLQHHHGFFCLFCALAVTSSNGLRLQDKAVQLSSETSISKSPHENNARLAQKEEGMKITDEPYFIKWPRSWVEKCDKLNHTKIRKYNFIGRLSRHWTHAVQVNQRVMRAWTIPFAKKYFGENDYYKASDEKVKDTDWVALGQFDKTLEPYVNRTSDHNYDKDGDQNFDHQYMEIMSQSNFSLCPAGDTPWTYRYFEAAAVGSICIVQHASDFGGNELRSDTALINPPWHFYVLEDIIKDPSKLVYREDWVKENRENFIKYHTYMQGDNYPPGSRRAYFHKYEHFGRYVFETLDQDGDGQLSAVEIEEGDEKKGNYPQLTSVMSTLRKVIASKPNPKTDSVTLEEYLAEFGKRHRNHFKEGE